MCHFKPGNHLIFVQYFIHKCICALADTSNVIKDTYLNFSLLHYYLFLYYLFY